MDAARVVEALGPGWRLVGPFAGGEHGAFEVSDPAGERFALKIGLDATRAVASTSVLRSGGYPAPEYRALTVDGTPCSLSSVLPGAPLGMFDARPVDQIVRLVDLHAGVEIDGPPWVEWLAATVVDGGPGYCLHATMRAYSPECATLLDRVRSVAAARATIEWACDDIVHFDLTHANTLAVDGRVTGIIDWEGCTRGDRTFDLFTFGYYTYDDAARTALFDAARARTHPDLLPLYAAHLALRQVEWCARKGDHTGVQWFLGISERVLGEAASVR